MEVHAHTLRKNAWLPARQKPIIFANSLNEPENITIYLRLQYKIS